MSVPADDLPFLRGRSVLIAESNSLIELDLTETLRSWGAEPLLYNDLPEDRQAAAPGEVCAALVDMSHPHPRQTDLIEALLRHNVPVVMTTAWQLDIVGAQFPGMTVFEKPVDYAALAQWFKENGGSAPAEQRCSNG